MTHGNSRCMGRVLSDMSDERSAMYAKDAKLFVIVSGATAVECVGGLRHVRGHLRAHLHPKKFASRKLAIIMCVDKDDAPDFKETMKQSDFNVDEYQLFVKRRLPVP